MANIGEAIEGVKNGKKFARSGWNGKNVFIYYVRENKYPVERNSNSPVKGEFENDMVPYQAYVAMKTADGTVVPWLCSQTDLLAEDWVEVS